MSEHQDRPKTSEEVVNDELICIERLRAGNDSSAIRQTDEDTPTDQNDPRKRAEALRLTGLALSGGGIRSATFSLGVIQALAELRVLRHFDYLSTVSGGGFIGGWLSALLYRSRKKIDNQPNINVSKQTLKKLISAGGDTNKVLDAIQGELSVSNQDASTPAESPAVTELRRYSNYLTPRRGILKADALASVTMYVTNTSLNLIGLISLLAAIVMIPLIIVDVMDMSALSVTAHSVATLVPLVLTVLSLTTLFCLRWAKGEQIWLLLFGVLPSLIGAMMLIEYVYRAKQKPEEYIASLAATRELYEYAKNLPLPGWIYAAGAGAFAYGFLTLIASIGGKLATMNNEKNRSQGKRFCFHVGNTVAALIAGGLGGVILYATREWIPSDRWYRLGFVSPAMIFLFVGINSLHLGLLGRSVSEITFEWSARLNGWLLLSATTIAALFAILTYAPKLGDTGWMVGPLWMASSAAGVLLGWGTRTDGSASSLSWRELVATSAPYIFILGLIVAVARLMDRMPFLGYPCLVALLVLIFGVALTWRIDINLFSMFQYYRNRLVRAYLGSSRKERKPDFFTGLDINGDDLRLSDLEQRPYPIINATLNLVGGKELAWQQRRAASFAMTPRHVGFTLQLNGESSDHGSYRPTHCYAQNGGMRLGDALAISGAAASPNMGYHSSPAVAFLMTIFNVRLGRWCGNPAVNGNRSWGPDLFKRRPWPHPPIWKRSGPKFGAWYMLRELFSLTNERSGFVYLSDGGHFDNLGVYELVRRHCRFIVVCDAAQDSERSFSELGNTIRKCYTDFGVNIEIDVNGLKRNPATGYSAQHCTVGVIRYETANIDAPSGILLYIKATLTGNEPAEVLTYAARHLDFPHQSTANQWFQEDQFEAYRKLGNHIAMGVFRPAMAIALVNAAKTHGLDNAAKPQSATPGFAEIGFDLLSDALQLLWKPKRELSTGLESRLNHSLENLYDHIRSDKNSRFVVFPATDKVYSVAFDEMTQALPAKPEEFRAGFLQSAAMLEYMKTVYTELDLERDSGHPDNSAWVHLFKNWASSAMLRVTWGLTNRRQPPRFRKFCETQLGLDLGELTVDRAEGFHENPKQYFEKTPSFDDFERSQLTKLIDQTSRPNAEHRVKLELYEFKLETKGSDKPFRQFGCALFRNDILVYFHIRKLLRRNGLGRTALDQLKKKRTLTIEFEQSTGLSQQEFDRFSKWAKICA